MEESVRVVKGRERGKGGGEEQRETRVKEILHAACQNVGIKH